MLLFGIIWINIFPLWLVSWSNPPRDRPNGDVYSGQSWNLVFSFSTTKPRAHSQYGGGVISRNVRKTTSLRECLPEKIWLKYIPCIYVTHMSIIFFTRLWTVPINLVNAKEKDQSVSLMSVCFTKRRECRHRLLGNLFTTFLRRLGLPDLTSTACCAFMPACVLWNFRCLLSVAFVVPTRKPWELSR